MPPLVGNERWFVLSPSSCELGECIPDTLRCANDAFLHFLLCIRILAVIFRTIHPDRHTVCFCVWHILCICISPLLLLPPKTHRHAFTFAIDLSLSPSSLFSFFFIFVLQNMQSHHGSCSSSPVIVAQNLDMEQKNYEFPPRALLLQLSAHLDKDSYYEMFDESSFATTTMTGSSVDRYDDIASDDDEKLDSFIGSIVSSYQQQQHQSSRNLRRSMISYDDEHRESNHLSCFNQDHHHENDNDDDPRVQRLIEDDRLSPLLLPARADQQRTCQSSYDTRKRSSNTQTMDLVAPSSFLKRSHKGKFSWLDPLFSPKIISK